MFSCEKFNDGYLMAGCSVDDQDYPPIDGIIRGEMYKQHITIIIFLIF